MKVMTGSIKGLGALFVVWMTYIDKTFSPLFWVLLVLVFIDLILNVHKEGQQFAKLGSMALSLGVPTYIAGNFGNPELGKYLVAIMCICYLQLVIPQLLKVVGGFKFSKDPKEQQFDVELLDALVTQAAARLEKKAQDQAAEAKQASIGPVTSQDKTGGA